MSPLHRISWDTAGVDPQMSEIDEIAIGFLRSVVCFCNQMKLKGIAKMDHFVFICSSTDLEEHES